MKTTRTVAVALAAVLLAACGETNRSDLPTVEKAAWCPVGSTNQFDARQVLGKPEAQGRAGAEAGGCTMRVVSRDGVGLAVRQDWRPDRINVMIDDGVVTAVRTDCRPAAEALTGSAASLCRAFIDAA